MAQGLARTFLIKRRGAPSHKCRVTADQSRQELGGPHFLSSFDRRNHEAQRRSIKTKFLCGGFRADDSAGLSARSTTGTLIDL